MSEPQQEPIELKDLGDVLIVLGKGLVSLAKERQQALTVSYEHMRLGANPASEISLSGGNCDSIAGSFKLAMGLSAVLGTIKFWDDATVKIFTISSKSKLDDLLNEWAKTYEFPDNEVPVIKTSPRSNGAQNAILLARLSGRSVGYDIGRSYKGFKGDPIVVATPETPDSAELIGQFYARNPGLGHDG